MATTMILNTTDLRRVEAVFKDKTFQDFCLQEMKDPMFEETIAMCEKIAKIDNSKVQYDRDLLSYSWTKEEILSNLLEFYKNIDKSSPDQDRLVPIVKKNLKYFTLKKSNNRSGCGVRNNNGKITRNIDVNYEGRFGDLGTTIHEFCHSLSKSFIDAKPKKDQRMEEICTVITDMLTGEFLIDKYPELLYRVENNYRFAQYKNVEKAKESLIDAYIIKCVNGNITKDELQQKYTELFGSNKWFFDNRLNRIEKRQYLRNKSGKIDYIPMYESKYLMPQAIAQLVLEQYYKNPDKTLNRFKKVLLNDEKVTLEEVIKYLDLPSKEEIIDNYVSNYNQRLENNTTEQDLEI